MRECMRNADKQVALPSSCLARPGIGSNREVSEHAGIKDQGQISKLLARLQDHGLLRNTGPVIAGAPKAWQLTPQGEEIIHASRPNTVA